MVADAIRYSERMRKLGAAIMLLAGCYSTGAQSSRRPTVQTKPYVDACIAADDKQCLALCNAAFEVAADSEITSCSYTVEGETTVIHMTYGPRSEEPVHHASGRRPPGWDARAAGASIADYLAWCAAMEAASVTAFARIHRHLVATNAPVALLARVEAAISDELSHARVVAGLARRYGASPHMPEIPPEPTMTALERAIDHAVEGCVGETVAALHAAFLGEHAVDPLVRAAFAQIAEDEIRHAYLAFELVAHASTTLTADERVAVADARERAVMRAQAAPLHPGLLALGIPALRVQRAVAELLADPAAQLA